MKICLIHHKLGLGGGMEALCFNLMGELVRQGHHVDIYVMEADPQFKLPETVKLTVMPVNKATPKFLRKFVFAYTLKKHLQHQHYDLRISLTRSFSQDVIIPGGTHKAYMQGRRLWRLKDWLEAYFETIAYQQSRYIIAQSATMQQELQTLYHLPAEKIVVLYPPVDPHRLSFTHHKPHKPMRLLFISSSHKRKGGLLLVDALKTLPAADFELWVVGRPFPQAHTLKQSVKELGFVKDLPPVYHETDLLLLPSYFEPFGLVIVEALQSGLPILASRACGVTPLVGKTEGLILETQEASALAALLLQAKTQNFAIQPKFIERHQLALSDYVRALLKLTV